MRAAVVHNKTIWGRALTKAAPLVARRSSDCPASRKRQASRTVLERGHRHHRRARRRKKGSRRQASREVDTRKISSCLVSRGTLLTRGHGLGEEKGVQGEEKKASEEGWVSEQ